MKKITSLFILFFATLLIFSCTTPSDQREPTGVTTTKTFDPSDFDAVDYGSSFEVEIKESSIYKVTATGDETDIADLSVDVIGGVLEINYANSALFDQINRGKVQLIIETPFLNSIDAGGASKTFVNGFDVFESLVVDVSGSSKLELNAAVKSLKIDISGASDVTLTQDVGTMEGDISGSSSLSANDKSTLKATLDLSGASSADIFVEEELIVDVSGASTVRYTGDPRVKEETSGAGRVVKK